MRRLIAGPWVGEFGWELFSWQGAIRALAPRYDEVIICGPKGHEPLYKDFYNDYLPHEIQGTKDCWHMADNGSSALNSIKDRLRKITGDQVRPVGYVTQNIQKHIQFGVKVPDRCFDIVIHARGAVGTKPQRSWPIEQWNIATAALHARGLRIAAIGNAALLPVWAEDFRNIPLQDTMNLLASSTMAAGTSSGPMHLTSLCKTPHVVWADKTRYVVENATSRDRYEKIWNPFQTPVKFIDDMGWHPPVEVVVSTILKGLEEWRKV